MTEEKKIEMPPYPERFFDFSEDNEKNLRYKGEPDDINSRVAQKIFNTWVLWTNIRNDEKLIDIINKHSDTESEDFYLKNTIVRFLDCLGKILGNTNITEEIFKLSNKEKDASED